MMITIKSPREIEPGCGQAGKIAAAARSAGSRMVRPGVTTEEIDQAIRECILSCGASPTFLHYGGFPKNACISVNNEVIHGIPGNRVIREGDIVSLDVGATYKGYVGDCAGTFPAGEVTPEAKELIRVTRQSFSRASGTPGRAAGCGTSPGRSRSTPRPMAIPWYGNTWGTGWEKISMRTRRFPTMSRRAGATPG